MCVLSGVCAQGGGGGGGAEGGGEKLWIFVSLALRVSKGSKSHMKITKTCEAQDIGSCVD